MTSTKIQNLSVWINLNDQKFNDKNSFSHPYGQVLIIDIWNLFVFCYLLFGALFQNLSDFMDRHQILYMKYRITGLFCSTIIVLSSQIVFLLIKSSLIVKILLLKNNQLLYL